MYTFIADNFIIIQIIFICISIFGFGFIFGFIFTLNNNVRDDIKSLDYDRVCQENEDLKKAIEIKNRFPK